MIFFKHFSIVTLTWKLCQTFGEGPGIPPINLLSLSFLGFRYQPQSFILQDNLYIYGGEKGRTTNSSTQNIFMLNFSKLS